MLYSSDSRSPVILGPFWGSRSSISQADIQDCVLGFSCLFRAFSPLWLRSWVPRTWSVTSHFAVTDAGLLLRKGPPEGRSFTQKGVIFSCSICMRASGCGHGNCASRYCSVTYGNVKLFHPGSGVPLDGCDEEDGPVYAHGVQEQLWEEGQDQGSLGWGPERWLRAQLPFLSIK